MIYKFSVKRNKKVTGVEGSQLFPDQSSPGMKELYDFFIWENNSYSNVGSTIKFDFRFITKLEKKALLTDVMSQGHLTEEFGIIVSEKFKKFISDFKIIDCFWYEITIKDSKGKVMAENYYWMYPIRLVDSIDFQQTSLDLAGKLFYTNESEFLNLRLKYKELHNSNSLNISNISRMQFESLEQFEIVTDPRKFILKEALEEKYDFFGLKYNYRWYVSEKMKLAFERSGLTGFTIEDFNVNDKILEVKNSAP